VNKGRTIWAAAVLIALLLSVVTTLGATLLRQRQATRLRMEQLASRLGVSIDDYPYPRVFPAGYFDSILEKGMSPSDVHQVVQGYATVWRCGDLRELYYYYSTDDDIALRFMIFYDQDKRFLRLQGEDDDSRTLRTDGCQEGLLIEP
jgi:hypothetical protein